MADVTVNGDTWHFSALSIHESDKLLGWLRDQYVKGVARHTAELSSEERMTMLREAIDHSWTLTVDSPEANGIMATTAGLHQMIYVSLKRCHADITFARVQEVFNTSALLVEASEAIAKVADEQAKSEGAEP